MTNKTVKSEKNDVETPAESATFPSIRAQMGDIEYFIATLTFAEVAKWIKKPEQTSEKDNDFKTWLQREIDPKRLSKIANYLSVRDQRFFNAIVVGIFGGNPNWFPVTVDYVGPDEIKLDKRTRSSMGILRLAGDEQAFSIDGQHRVEAIKEALATSPSLAEDELSVIFIAHAANAAGRKRTRRLFSTLNKYAKPVSPGEIVALDEDDAFAIVTRELTDRYKPLKGLITYTRSANLIPTDLTGVTTTVGLYELLQILPRPFSKPSTSTLKIGPSEDHEDEIRQLYEIASTFWDELAINVASVGKVLSSPPSKNLAGKERSNGGNMLFRPAGQQAFARALRSMVNDGLDLIPAIKMLSAVELDISKAPWPGVLWNPSNNTMILKGKTLMHNLLLHMTGSTLSPPNFDLLTEYRKALGDDAATLPN